MSVRRIPAQHSDEMETIQIVFRVDHAIRGSKVGQRLTVREWAGLWSTGERYRAGERVLLFLYPPSKLGLTSPVGGPQGRFAIDPHGQVIVGDSVDDPDRPAAEPAGPAREKAPNRNLVSLREFAKAIRAEEK